MNEPESFLLDMGQVKQLFNSPLASGFHPPSSIRSAFLLSQTIHTSLICSEEGVLPAPVERDVGALRDVAL